MDLDYSEWRAGDAARHAANEPFVRGAELIERTRPRSRDEAEFLREIGTPERLIGPIRDDAPEAPAR